MSDLAIVKIYLGDAEVLTKTGLAHGQKTLMIDPKTLIRQLRDELYSKVIKGMTSENVTQLQAVWGSLGFALGPAEADGYSTFEPQRLGEEMNVWEQTQTPQRPSLHFILSNKKASKKGSRKINTKSKSLPRQRDLTMFGRKLISLCTWAGYSWILPAWLLECVDIIVANSDIVGIFRISPLKTELDEVRELINTNRDSALSSYSVHVVAGTLKAFLLELPESLFPDPLISILEEVSGWEDGESKAQTVKKLIYSLPEPSKTLWLRLNQMFRVVLDRADINKMTAQNLAVVFAPSIFKIRGEDEMSAMANVMGHQRIVCELISDAASMAIPPRVMPTAWARWQPGPSSPSSLIIVHSSLPNSLSSSSSPASPPPSVCGIIARTGEPCPDQIDPSHLTILYQCATAPPPLSRSTHNPSRSSALSPSPNRSLSALEEHLFQLCYRLIPLAASSPANADEVSAIEGALKQLDPRLPNTSSQRPSSTIIPPGLTLTDAPAISHLRSKSPPAPDSPKQFCRPLRRSPDPPSAIERSLQSHSAPFNANAHLSAAGSRPTGFLTLSGSQQQYPGTPKDEVTDAAMRAPQPFGMTAPSHSSGSLFHATAAAASDKPSLVPPPSLLTPPPMMGAVPPALSPRRGTNPPAKDLPISPRPVSGELPAVPPRRLPSPSPSG